MCTTLSSYSDGSDRTVPVGKETIITVDAAQAGVGKVTCRIRSSSGSDIDIDIVDQGDGTFSISFIPQFPGPYTIEIKFGGELVPNGSYTVQVTLVCCAAAYVCECHLLKFVGMHFLMS